MSDTTDIDNPMTAYDLATLRTGIGRTQAKMAEDMGLSRRAYIDIETGASPLRKIHQLAAERVFIHNVAATRSIGGIDAVNQRVVNDVCGAAPVIKAASDDDRSSIPKFTG